MIAYESQQESKLQQSTLEIASTYEIPKTEEKLTTMNKLEQAREDYGEGAGHHKRHHKDQDRPVRQDTQRLHGEDTEGGEQQETDEEVVEADAS